MRNDIQHRASVMVRAAIARYLVVPIERVACDQSLERDLLLDDLELAVILMALEAELGANLDCTHLRRWMTVDAVAEVVGRALTECTDERADQNIH
jgi:acyl carrier protein